MPTQEVEELRRVALTHLRFVAVLRQRGARFLHEHPASAQSRSTPKMEELLGRLGVGSVAGR
eukprot:13295274-Alexandrium_andersonii.AAC.1